MRIVKDEKVSRMFKGGGPIFQATHKGVEMTVAVGDTWVSIYSIKSKKRNKGEAQEAILILKKRFNDKELWGSAPLNPIITHIFDKLKVKYGDDNEVSPRLL